MEFLKRFFQKQSIKQKAAHANLKHKKWKIRKKSGK